MSDEVLTHLSVVSFLLTFPLPQPHGPSPPPGLYSCRNRGGGEDGLGVRLKSHLPYLKMAMRDLVVCWLKVREALSKSPRSRAACRYAAILRASTTRCVPPARRDVLGL